MRVTILWAVLLVPLLTACASAGIEAITLPSAAPVPEILPDPDAGQPRYASYECGGGRSLTVENFQTSVLVVVEARDGVELPASPPGQTRSYGDGRSRLVLEGTRAEFAREGRPQLNCRR